MPPSPDSCVACNRAFPANNELASLPHGKRIAFDPELNRVWRICTKCGEWNLLGAEAGAAVSAELRARLPVLTTGSIVHEAIGAIDVIAVTTRDDAAATSGTALSARRTMTSQARYATIIKVMATALILAPQVRYWIEGSDWQSRPEIMANGIAAGAGWILGTEGARRRDGRAVRRGWIAAGVTGLVASLGIVVVTNHSWFGWIYFLLLGAMQFLSTVVASPSRTLVLGDDERVVMDRQAASAARIGYAPVASTLVADNLPGDRVLYGDDVLRLIGHVMVWEALEPSAESVEQGWLLLRRHHDVEGVIIALGESRPHDNRRHTWSEIPVAWQMALHFGVIEASGTETEREAIRDQIRDASEVAAIAESLDAEAGAADLLLPVPTTVPIARDRSPPR